VRASRAFHWRKKGPKSPFFIVPLDFINRSAYTLVILVHLYLFFIFFYMLIVLVCFNLILVYSFVVLFLTFYSTAVMPSRAQLGM
jgi:hypothetical protein